MTALNLWEKSVSWFRGIRDVVVDGCRLRGYVGGFKGVVDNNHGSSNAGIGGRIDGDTSVDRFRGVLSWLYC